MMMVVVIFVMVMMVVVVPPPVVMVMMMVVILMMVVMMMVGNELHVWVPATLAIRRGSGCVCDSQNSGSVWNRIEQLAV